MIPFIALILCCILISIEGALFESIIVKADTIFKTGVLMVIASVTIMATIVLSVYLAKIFLTMVGLV